MAEHKRQDDDFEQMEGVPARRRRLFSSRDLRATTIGWEIAIPIVGGPFLGFILDRRLDTGVRWTFILLGVGLISAILAVVKYIRYEFYLINKEKKEEETKGIKKEWRNYDDE
ncbi:MAG: AtpZ/AtpI family protein [Chloroflexi bacterium]|nr:AtpZ/AtpI family protein [Chloroflexota bacterium]